MPPECHACGTYWANGAPGCGCDGREPRVIIRELQSSCAAKDAEIRGLRADLETSTHLTIAVGDRNRELRDTIDVLDGLIKLAIRALNGKE
jgi:hypothetical protein